MFRLKQRARFTMAISILFVFYARPSIVMSKPPSFVSLPASASAAAATNIGNSMAIDNGPSASSVQSKRRAYSLDIVDVVMARGSDSASSDFMTNHLPDLGIAVQQDLSEFHGVENAAAMAIDLSKLKLATDASVRIYFITEGAGYHNAFGFNTVGSGIDEGDPKLIFPDASSPVSLLHSSNALPSLNKNTPLLPGDFVELGSMAGGTQLDFFLIAQGMTGKPVYSTDETVNPDGIQHVVTLALEDSPFLIMGFEDLWGGGDRDFNDLVVAIDIGEENVAHMSAAPEPSTAIMFAVFLGIAWFKEEDEVCEDVA